MKEKIAEQAKKLLERKRVCGFLALRQEGGQVGPYLFTDPAQLDQLHLGDGDEPGDCRYSLVKLLSRLLLQAPGESFAILVRGCDERALMRLYHDDRVTPLNPRRVVPLGFSCPPELARKCRCPKPWPEALVAGEKNPGPEPDPERPPTRDLMAELQQWFQTFDRCVKCFGCRDNCPVCSCLECTMAEEGFIPQRELPASPNFLMTKALHMVDRCVYCGLCELACPANIPLRDLFRLVARISSGGCPDSTFKAVC